MHILKLLFVGTVMILGNLTSAQEITSDTLVAETDLLSSDELVQMPKPQLEAWQTLRRLAPYEPGKPGDAERVQDYTRIFKEQNVFDSRLSVCNMNVTVLPNVDGQSSVPVSLSGEVLDARYKNGFAQILSQLGFEVKENLVSVLPAEEFLGKYAYVPAGPESVTLRSEPRAKAEQVNSVAPGNWVRLLRRATEIDLKGLPADGEGSVRSAVTDWVLVQTDEGYVGYSPRKLLSEDSEEIHLADGMLLESVSVGERQICGGSQLMKRAGKWMVVTPHENPTVLPTDARIAEYKVADTEQNILDCAKALLGKKYVWGGKTDNGLDCSGLSQWYARSRGVMLPRDAAEQSICGRITAFGMDVITKAQAGDLVFFSNNDGRITHVGVSLGNGKLLHASSRPGVCVQALIDSEHGETTSAMSQRLQFSRRLW